MKAAVLGPRGTYTHQAAEEYFTELEPMFCTSIEECLDYETALIPFENSIQGGVSESIDLLKRREPTVTGEHRMSIRHVLATKDSLADTDVVTSHPQALAQCRGFIEEEGFETRDTSSTAAAARDLSKDEAAVCSELAAQLNGLDVVEEDIQMGGSNTTRFLAVGGPETEPQKTSAVIEPVGNQPGLLESVLSCLSGHGIDLSYIQSRPAGDGMGDYFFYVEAEQPSKSDSFQKAKQCIETYGEITVLGSYS